MGDSLSPEKVIAVILIMLFLTVILFPFPTLPEEEEHREWNWADEQGWKRCFVLPIAELDKWTKNTSNPIFTDGASGKFDDYGVQHCNVLYVDSYYYMFYGGVKAAGPFPEYVKGIGVARATDPFGPFTRLNDGDAIVTPPNVGWGCGIPSVIYDTLESDLDKRWKMFYEVWPTSATYQIWYDYSASPDSGWGVNEAVTNMAIGHWGPSVMRVGNSFWGLSPTAAKDLQFSTCPVDDPTGGWTNHGVVIARGAADTWDDLEVRYVTMTYIQGLFYALYSGNEGAVMRIGMAASGPDLGFAWTKWGRNYVLDRGAGALDWDRRYIFSPSIIQFEDTFYLYYTGATAADAWDRNIGVAMIP